MTLHSSQTPASDFVDRGHLDGENDILERQVLNKSCSYNDYRYPEHPNPVRMTPMSSQTPTLDFVDKGHVDGGK